jgi:transcriptional regulator with XRE-family HTH domain
VRQYLEHLKKIGGLLRHLRIEKGLSPAQVAAQLGTSERVIYLIEAGQSDTAASRLLRFAALVGASGDELVALFSEEAAV